MKSRKVKLFDGSYIACGQFKFPKEFVFKLNVLPKLKWFEKYNKINHSKKYIHEGFYDKCNK